MPKFFFALEKKTLEAYRDSRNEAAEATPKMSSTEISEWKTELIKTANIRALPSEVESSRFEPPPFFSVDGEGTAHIEVSGVLLNFVDFFDFFFDDPITTFGFIREAALRAEEDPQVKKIRFNVSTPGGMVDGVDLTSQVIANLNKPTETVGFGQISSAGIWLFSQTDKITSSDPTVFFGSIGVATTIIDRSKMREEMGIEIIELTNDASPDKRPDLSTDEGRGIVIKELNDLFGIFVQRVAEGRKTTIQDVKKNFGKGGVLIAADAQKVGLIDQVDLQDSGPASLESKRSSANQNPNEEKIMNLDQFLAENPAEKVVYDQRLKDAKADGEKAGAEAEQTEANGRHTKILNILDSDVYSKADKAIAMKAAKKEVSMETFDTVIAMADARIEEANANAADGEQEEDTEAGATQKSNDGIVRNDEDEAAAIANLRGK